MKSEANESYRAHGRHHSFLFCNDDFLNWRAGVFVCEKQKRMIIDGQLVFRDRQKKKYLHSVDTRVRTMCLVAISLEVLVNRKGNQGGKKNLGQGTFDRHTLQCCSGIPDHLSKCREVSF